MLKVDELEIQITPTFSQLNDKLEMHLNFKSNKSLSLTIKVTVIYY
jgi:hypothetical protein